VSLIDTAGLSAITSHSDSDKHQFTEQPDKLAPYLTYTDRESYLAFVADWKSTYANLSATIRAGKAQWRAAGSDIPYPLVRDHVANRHLARTLLALRAAGKVDSRAKREAARDGVGVSA
jgi:hypothetical protein